MIICSMITRNIAIIVVALIVVTIGCIEPPLQVRRVAWPAIEQPPVNLPQQLRQRNWVARGESGKPEGSCVHASLVMLLNWHNRVTEALRWKATYGGGEYATELEARLRAAKIGYRSTRTASSEFLDYVSETRKGALLWWKPNHCCLFAGWVKRDGVWYAAIIDNNYPERFELTERSQFLRLWQSYGGYALTITSPPTIPIPYPTWEYVR